jgi:hypothetical protein
LAVDGWFKKGSTEKVKKFLEKANKKVGKKTKQ